MMTKKSDGDDREGGGTEEVAPTYDSGGGGDF
jgi:hypothetical protein